MMTDRVIVVCTIVVAAVYLYATTLIPTLAIGDPLGPKAFPRLLGIALLIGAGLLVVEIVRAGRPGVQSESPAIPDRRHLQVLAAVAVWTALFYAAFELLGYGVATTVYLLALMAWFNRGRWFANVASAVLFSASSYALFIKLDVNLPKGLLPF